MFHNRNTVPAALVAGTLVADDIGYVLPFGLLGRLISPLVRFPLQRSFAQRQKRLPQMLAAAQQAAREP